VAVSLEVIHGLLLSFSLKFELVTKFTELVVLVEFGCTLTLVDEFHVMPAFRDQAKFSALTGFSLLTLYLRHFRILYFLLLPAFVGLPHEGKENDG